MKIIITFLAATLASSFAGDFFATSNHNFSVSLYQKLATQPGNLLVSPLSAQLVLALSQLGARHATAAELQTVLSLPNDTQAINRAVNDVFLRLEHDHNYTFQTVNKIFVKYDCPLNEEFAQIAQEVYRAQLAGLDFSKGADAAHVINQWVEAETDGKIKNLVSEDLLKNETRALLVNALRFRANWTKPFHFFATFKDDFFYKGDARVHVETMHVAEEVFQYYEKKDFGKFVVLPMEGGNASMTIAVPAQRDGLWLLEKHIDEVLREPETMTTELLNVAMPKFRIQAKINLKHILQQLGVVNAFEDGAADFSGIAGEKGELFISDVVQKTYVDVNEYGMEAAAATFIVKIINRNANDARDFYINQPFIFFVKVNGLIVFLGRVLLPEY